MEVDTDMDETDDETEDKNEIVLGVTHHCLISFSVTAWSGKKIINWIDYKIVF